MTTLELAVVRATPVDRAIRTATWAFEMATPSGMVLRRSATFTSNSRQPTPNPVERKALDDLIALVRSEGWTIVAWPLPDDPWWGFRLARGDEAAVSQEADRIRNTPPAPIPLAPVSDGIPGVWWMWGLTMLIVVGLFALCVLLALTSTITVGPA